MSKEKEEKWKIEIKRLDKIRLRLGISFYKLESITGISRGNLQKILDTDVVPSLERYFVIKDALESEIEVKK